MPVFTIYKASGEIAGIVGCREDEAAEAAQSNGADAYIEGNYDYRTHRIVGGVAVEFPARPSPQHTWDWAAGEWRDPRTLEQVKAAKNEEINRARAAANSSTFTFVGKQIAVDDLSMKDIQSASGIISLTGALPGGWPGAWKAVDNTYVLIPDIATWTAFYGAMVAQGTANFLYSQQLKAAMEAAVTLAEVDAITWNPT